jgi:hypothetical protein
MKNHGPKGGDGRRSAAGPRPPAATLRGETVEARILLSATWDYVHQGTNGNDTLSGQAGNGLLVGGAGNDVLRGSLGDDDLRGGDGIDLIDYSIANSGVSVNLRTGSASGAFGNDTLSGIEVVRGSAYADRITDSCGDDTIHGGAGDDSVWTYAGNDVIDGGAGHDTVYFTRAGRVDVDVTMTTEQNTGGAGRKTFTNVEGFVGSWENDVFRFSAPASGSSFVIDGDTGEDHIDLTGWSSTSALVDGNTVVVDLGSGRSFRIDFTNVELVQFADTSMPFGGDGIQPVAEAGPDQTVTEGSVVTLDASQTTAGGGGASRYTWIQVSGPVVALVDEHAEKPTFTAPNVLTDAVIEFKLVVSDGDAISTDAVSITVRGDDDAPLAYAGADQAATAGQLVQLDAGLSEDPEGQPVTYTWTQVGGPPVTLSDPHAARPTFTAPSSIDVAAVEFVVQVSDGRSVDSDRITVTTAPKPTFGRWTFDEGTTQSVQNVDDSSGNNRNGTLGRVSGTGSIDAVRVVDPQLGRAVEFAGAQLVGSLGNGPSGDFAVAAWFRYDSGTSQQTIYSTDNGREIWLGVHAGSGRVEMSVGGVNDYIKTGNGVVVGGQWQHVTATWDGTVGRIFIDGVEVATSVAGSPHAPIARSATIGARDDGSTLSREWRGRIDDVRVFDHAVSAADAARMAGDVAPIADAGVDRSVDPDDVVTLDASGSSDPDGRPLSYRWIQTEGPVVTLADPNAAKPTFTAPRLEHAVAYKFDVVVSDDFTCRVDSVVVTVNADTTDDPPIARAGDDQTVVEGVRVRLDGTGSSDPEGQTLTYAWTQVSGPAVTLSDPTAARPEFTAPELSGAADIQFKLTVSDGVHQTTDVVTIRVDADDDAPVASAGQDQSVVEGDRVRLDASASADPEGRALTYEWTQISGPTVTLTDPTAARPEFRAPELREAADIQFQLTVSDGVTESTDVVTIHVDADDDAPVASAGDDQTVAEGDVVRLDGTASADPEGKALTYEWTQISGPTVTLSDPTAARPEFRAPELREAADIRFQLTVGDGVHRTSDVVSIHVDADDDAPTVTVKADGAVRGGAAVSLRADGQDPEGTRLTYSWQQVGGPAVQLSDAASAAPTFRAPILAEAARLQFVVGVSDGATTTRETVDMVVEATAAPTVAVQPVPNAGAGEYVMVQATASGTVDAPMTYAWTQMSGPQVQLAGSDRPQLMFMAPSLTRGGELVFQLQVTQAGLTTTQIVSVFVDPSAPAASAPAPAAVAPAAVVNVTAAVASSPAVAAPASAAAAPAAAATASAAAPTPTEQFAADLAQDAAATIAELMAMDALDDAGATDAAGSVTAASTNTPGTVVQAAMLSAPPETASESVRSEQQRMTFRTLNDAARADAFADDGDLDRNLLDDPAESTGRAASGSTKVLAPDLVVAESGNAVTLQPRLPANAVATGVEPANVRWTQTGGTPLELDETEGSALHVRLPEVFTEEELVFQVEVMHGDVRLVQEVAVQVQPVGMTNRALSIDDMAVTAAQDAGGGGDDGAGRGVGKVWGAMLAFLGAQAGRRRSDG